MIYMDDISAHAPMHLPIDCAQTIYVRPSASTLFTYIFIHMPYETTM